jgi:hypothetical protein
MQKKKSEKQPQTLIGQGKDKNRYAPPLTRTMFPHLPFVFQTCLALVIDLTPMCHSLSL